MRPASDHSFPHHLPAILAAILLLAATSLPAVPVAAQSPGPAPEDAANGAGDEAQTPRTFLDALEDGELTLSLRYRFENVDQDPFRDDGHASTLRTALGYRTAAWRGLSFEVQFENVADLGFEDQHDNAGAGDLDNGVRDRPVIADPPDTEVQQVFLSYAFDPDTTLHAGRQELNLGSQRFLGAVGWRQNHQAFDAFRLESADLPRTRLTYLYLDRVHRIFGDSQPMGSHALYAEVDAGGPGTVVLQAYRLDYDDRADLRLSTATYFAGLRGSRGLGSPAAGEEPEAWSLTWDLGYAEQRDAGDNPFDIDTAYRRAELGLARGGFRLAAGAEILEGGRGGAFRTPLATLHKFNGWADKFLATPPAGLEDLYLSVGGSVGGWDLTAVYHDFSAEAAGADYGSEMDLQALYRLPWKQVIGVKAAFYDADQFATDTDKVWLWTGWGL